MKKFQDYFYVWADTLSKFAVEGKLTSAILSEISSDNENLYINKLNQQLSEKDYSLLPEIEILIDASSIKSAAYSSTTQKIYLNKNWIKNSSKEDFLITLTEELGHHIDYKLNTIDTPGDEGFLFASKLFEKNLDQKSRERISSEDDSKTLTINGKEIPVEQSNSSSQTVFKTKWSSDSVNEDGEITLEIWLTTATSHGVTVTAQFDTNIWAQGNTSTNGETSLTFKSDDFHIKQSITFKPVDNLIITGDKSQQISLNFKSNDAAFDGLSETLSVDIIDNDFQRSIENNKSPSEGNNHIKYDFLGSSADNYPTNQDSYYSLGSGNDKLEITGSFQDKLVTKTILGESGNDEISGGTFISGGDGDDTLTTFDTGTISSIAVDQNSRGGTSYGNTSWGPSLGGSTKSAKISGGSGNDTISGGKISIAAAGGSGNDIITGSTDNDWIWGDGYNSFAANDRAGNNHLSEYFSGNTQDRSSLSTYGEFLPVREHTNLNGGNVSVGHSGIRININSTDGLQEYYGQYYFSDFGSANGANAGNDIINSGDGNDWIAGGGGNDVIKGGNGNDIIWGGSGNDDIKGEAGDNWIDGGYGDDTITAEEGSDTIYAGDGKDNINAGNGNNSIYSGGDNDIINSGTGNDTIDAGDGDDTVNSGIGDDTIQAGSGNDTIKSGAGHDVIHGGLGIDKIYGEQGSDEIRGNEGDDLIYGGDGNDTLYGGSGNDTLEAGSGDTSYLANKLYGEEGEDILKGGSASDEIDGGTENDTITGGDGNDLIRGGDGEDTISGEGGDDLIKGNKGRDTISGGAGSDTFSYGQVEYSSDPDVITDFTAGSGGDKVDLTELHTWSLQSAGDSWSGKEFTYTHGYITFNQNGADTVVNYDRDGLNETHSPIAIANLQSIDSSNILPGINSSPELSSKLYLLESNQLSAGLSEDSAAELTYRAVLGAAPSSDVTLKITGGDQIKINGSDQPVNLTFNSSNWWKPQEIKITAIDDLVIEGNIAANIIHTFTSEDTKFNGLSETLSVDIIDNDFQRSLENNKSPSEGHNHIKYDFLGTTADNYPTNQGSYYSLGSGDDKLEITGSFQAKLVNKTIYGGNGNDEISGGTFISGDDGDDTLTTSNTGTNSALLVDVNNKPWISQYNRNESYTHVGSNNSAKISGGRGNDNITGGNKSIAAAGGSGNDTITGSTGNDWIWGDGYNAFSSSNQAGDLSLYVNNVGRIQDRSSLSEYGEFLPVRGTTNLNGGSVRIGDSNIRIDISVEDGFQEYYGQYYFTDFGSANGTNAGDDIINSGDGNDWIAGGGGNDVIKGGNGNDIIWGGSGNDDIKGEAGDNWIDGGYGDDTITTEEGSDEIYGGDGKDNINAGNGNNVINSGGNDDIINSGTGNDTIDAGDGDDTVNSGIGDDNISAGSGKDTIRSGAGNDVIRGGLGIDKLYGEQGSDEIRGDEGDDLIYGGDGNDTLYGGAGNDTLEAGSGDTSYLANKLYGEAGEDILKGGSASDEIDGGTENDNITGGDGNDLIRGGDGEDTISGGGGDDLIKGNKGRDTISGGAGSDTFFYGQVEYSSDSDVITDFTAGSGGDKVDLTELHTSNPKVTFPADDYPFSLGYVRIQKDGQDTLIGYDEDGFHNNNNFISLTRLVNINPTDLTPENFIIGSAEKNYGFQRNGAVISILKSENESKIKYQIRLWGGAPSSDVKVKLSKKNGTEISSFDFNSDNWSRAQIIEVDNSNPTELKDLNLAITSNDTNYQGTGLTLGINDGELIAQRNALSQAHIPVFKKNVNTREISLTSTKLLTNNSISEKVKLIPISGSGGIIDADATISGKDIKLTLKNQAIEWIGNTTYIAEVQKDSVLNSGFRVSFGQIQNYQVNLSSENTKTQEGSDGEFTRIKFDANLDSAALSDIDINWEIVLDESNSAQQNDFLNNIKPSGTVKIKKNTTKASFFVDIKTDLIREKDETFKINLSNASNQELTFKNNLYQHIIANDDFNKLTGSIKYWKDNKPLKDINLNVSYSKINVSKDDQINFRNITRNQETGELSASLWVNAGSSNFENINFSFNKNNDSKFRINLNNQLFTNDWLKEINETNTNYSLSAIKIGNNNSSDIKIADLVLSLPSTNNNNAYLEWGLVGVTALEETHFDQSLTKKLVNGDFEIDTLNGDNGSYTLGIGKDPLANIGRRSIDSMDALTALRMSSGEITSDKLIHNIQWMAADVDKNGLIQAKDAWLINNYVVGKEEISSKVGSWEFIDSQADLNSLGMTNTKPTNNDYLNNIIFSDQNNHINITSFISGDINGSYISNLQ